MNQFENFIYIYVMIYWKQINEIFNLQIEILIGFLIEIRGVESLYFIPHCPSFLLILSQ